MHGRVEGDRRVVRGGEEEERSKGEEEEEEEELGGAGFHGLRGVARLL